MPDEASAAASKVTLHMVASLDGIIARPDNSVSWFAAAESPYPAGATLSEEEIGAFLKSIDCYLLGSRTYQHAIELGWPYGDTPTAVLTTRSLTSSRQNVEFHSGDAKTILAEKLAPRFRNIWLVGGASLAQRFLELGLVDEISLTIAPILLGEGLRLFGTLAQEQLWSLKKAVAYRNGFVELSYAVRREKA